MTSELEPVARRTLPQLPIEVWEDVINHLWDDKRALWNCKQVCRAWFPPSHFHLYRWITISNVKGVKASAKMLKWTPELWKRVHHMTIVGDGRKDQSVLSLAAIMLARKLSRLEWLTIWSSKWLPWTMHIDIFLHLSAFSVTHLNLCEVTFPSVTVFGRLVCALPHLVELLCHDLKFTHDHFHPDTSGLYHTHIKLRSFSITYMRSDAPILNFLAHPCISSHLPRLIISDPFTVDKSQCQWGWQRLLDAASDTLSELELNYPSPGQLMATEVSAGGSVPSFNRHISLQRLWLTSIDISLHNLDALCQVLLSIKSGQLREIVIIFTWQAEIFGINEETKKLLENYRPARRKEIDNYLSSDLFRMLGKVEFSIRPLFSVSVFPYRSAAIIAGEEQWKQVCALLFPRLAEQGILRATVRRQYDDTF